MAKLFHCFLSLRYLIMKSQQTENAVKELKINHFISFYVFYHILRLSQASKRIKKYRVISKIDAN